MDEPKPFGRTPDIQPLPAFTGKTEEGPGPWAVLTLVMGIVAIINCCTIIGAIFFGLFAVVFALVELSKEANNQASKSGKTLTIIGLILGLLGIIIGALEIAGIIMFLEPIQDWWQDTWSDVSKDFVSNR